MQVDIARDPQHLRGPTAAGAAHQRGVRLIHHLHKKTKTNSGLVGQ